MFINLFVKIALDTPSEPIEPSEETPIPPTKRKKGKQRLAKVDEPKLPFLRNRGLIAILAMAGAFLISFVVSPLVTAMSQKEMHTVVVASKEIPKGTKLEQSMLSTTTIPSNIYRPEMLTEMKQV